MAAFHSQDGNDIARRIEALVDEMRVASECFGVPEPATAASSSSRRRQSVQLPVASEQTFAVTGRCGGVDASPSLSPRRRHSAGDIGAVAGGSLAMCSLGDVQRAGLPIGNGRGAPSSEQEALPIAQALDVSDLSDVDCIDEKERSVLDVQLKLMSQCVRDLRSQHDEAIRSTVTLYDQMQHIEGRIHALTLEVAASSREVEGLKLHGTGLGSASMWEELKQLSASLKDVSLLSEKASLQGRVAAEEATVAQQGLGQLHTDFERRCSEVVTHGQLDEALERELRLRVEAAERAGPTSRAELSESAPVSRTEFAAQMDVLIFLRTQLSDLAACSKQAVENAEQVRNELDHVLVEVSQIKARQQLSLNTAALVQSLEQCVKDANARISTLESLDLVSRNVLLEHTAQLKDQPQSSMLSTDEMCTLEQTIKSAESRISSLESLDLTSQAALALLEEVRQNHILSLEQSMKDVEGRVSKIEALDLLSQASLHEELRPLKEKISSIEASDVQKMMPSAKALAGMEKRLSGIEDRISSSTQSVLTASVETLEQHVNNFSKRISNLEEPDLASSVEALKQQLSNFDERLASMEDLDSWPQRAILEEVASLKSKHSSMETLFLEQSKTRQGDMQEPMPSAVALKTMEDKISSIEDRHASAQSSLAAEVELLKVGHTDISNLISSRGEAVDSPFLRDTLLADEVDFLKSKYSSMEALLLAEIEQSKTRQVEMLDSMLSAKALEQSVQSLQGGVARIEPLESSSRTILRSQAVLSEDVGFLKEKLASIEAAFLEEIRHRICEKGVAGSMQELEQSMKNIDADIADRNVVCDARVNNVVTRSTIPDNSVDDELRGLLSLMEVRISCLEAAPAASKTELADAVKALKGELHQTPSEVPKLSSIHTDPCPPWLHRLLDSNVSDAVSTAVTELVTETKSQLEVITSRLTALETTSVLPSPSACHTSLETSDAIVQMAHTNGNAGAMDSLHNNAECRALGAAAEEFIIETRNEVAELKTRLLELAALRAEDAQYPAMSTRNPSKDPLGGRWIHATDVEDIARRVVESKVEVLQAALNNLTARIGSSEASNSALERLVAGNLAGASTAWKNLADEKERVSADVATSHEKLRENLALLEDRVRNYELQSDRLMTTSSDRLQRLTEGFEKLRENLAVVEERVNSCVLQGMTTTNDSLERLTEGFDKLRDRVNGYELQGKMNTNDRLQRLTEAEFRLGACEKQCHDLSETVPSIEKGLADLSQRLASCASSADVAKAVDELAQQLSTVAERVAPSHVNTQPSSPELGEDSVWPSQSCERSASAKFAAVHFFDRFCGIYRGVDSDTDGMCDVELTIDSTEFKQYGTTVQGVFRWCCINSDWPGMEWRLGQTCAEFVRGSLRAGGCVILQGVEFSGQPSILPGGFGSYVLNAGHGIGEFPGDLVVLDRVGMGSTGSGARRLLLERQHSQRHLPTSQRPTPRGTRAPSPSSPRELACQAPPHVMRPDMVYRSPRAWSAAAASAPSQMITPERSQSPMPLSARQPRHASDRTAQSTGSSSSTYANHFVNIDLSLAAPATPPMSNLSASRARSSSATPRPGSTVETQAVAAQKDLTTSVAAQKDPNTPQVMRRSIATPEASPQAIDLTPAPEALAQGSWSQYLAEGLRSWGGRSRDVSPTAAAGLLDERQSSAAGASPLLDSCSPAHRSPFASGSSMGNRVSLEMSAGSIRGRLPYNRAPSQSTVTAEASGASSSAKADPTVLSLDAVLELLRWGKKGSKFKAVANYMSTLAADGSFVKKKAIPAEFHGKRVLEENLTKAIQYFPEDIAMFLDMPDEVRRLPELAAIVAKADVDWASLSATASRHRHGAMFPSNMEPPELMPKPPEAPEDPHLVEDGKRLARGMTVEEFLG